MNHKLYTNVKWNVTHQTFSLSELSQAASAASLSVPAAKKYLWLSVLSYRKFKRLLEENKSMEAELVPHFRTRGKIGQ